MAPMPRFARACLALVVSLEGSLASPPGEGELLFLQQVSRHGARSPKLSYLKSCPDDPFNYKWDSWNMQLSGPGGLEAAAIGDVTRKTYGEWLGAYNGSHMTVRSVDSDRVLQTAEIAMASLFPEGTGPEQGLPSSPTFVPIHTVPEEDDDLLNCPAESCWKKEGEDYASWWDSTGYDIWLAGKAVADPVTKFCGNQALTNGKLKDQIDGVGFDRSQGFFSNEFTDEEIFAAQNLSIVLQRGLFASDEARTYMSGDLPVTLVDNMDNAIAQIGSDQAQRYVSYFTHRHAGYALAEFFKWGWAQNGIPEGQIQTGTTLWIELRRGEEEGQFDVVTKQWAPHCGDANAMSSCPAQAIPLYGCTRKQGTVCSIEEFRSMVTQRIARTGDWRSICSVEAMV